MNKQIIIHPFSRKLRNGLINPKNWPLMYWQELLVNLTNLGYITIQIGNRGETRLEEASKCEFDLSLEALTTLLKNSFTFISIDSFLAHLAYLIPKKGIVIFGQSDPTIFGYSDNINLLKNPKYLRKNQFASWEETQYYEKVFIKPDVVLEAVKQLENE